MSKANHKSLRGRFLLDGGGLSGSYFHRAVVLVCKHDAEGAFGLVLNQALELGIARRLEEELPVCLAGYPVYVGGPVQPGALTYLLRNQAGVGDRVMPGITFGHTLEPFEQGRIEDALHAVRLFAGYAGWSPGQLDDEVARKAWITHKANVRQVFEQDPNSLWRDLVRSMDYPQRLLADAPEDLDWN